MRWQLGPPPGGDEPPDDRWHSIRLPSPDQLVVIGSATGLGLVAGLLMIYRWTFDFDLLTLARPSVFAAVLLTPIVHELTHAATAPGGLTSSSLVLGFWPRKLLPYVTTLSPMSRKEFLASSIAPLLAWSFVPLAVFAWTSWPWLVAVSILNAGLAGGDILYQLLVVWQVPGAAHVRIRGLDVQWQHPDDAAA